MVYTLKARSRKVRRAAGDPPPGSRRGGGAGSALARACGSPHLARVEGVTRGHYREAGQYRRLSLPSREYHRQGDTRPGRHGAG
jgi:hypothetical protein